jgi:hypothetical protein
LLTVQHFNFEGLLDAFAKADTLLYKHWAQVTNRHGLDEACLDYTIGEDLHVCIKRDLAASAGVHG